METTVRSAVEATSGRPNMSNATAMRRDITDMIRLIRFVQQRRAEIAAGQGASDPAGGDELLTTLRRELEVILPLRHPACSRQRWLSRARTGAAWTDVGRAPQQSCSGPVGKERFYVAA